jgi:hypothetical protein
VGRILLDPEMTDIIRISALDLMAGLAGKVRNV